MGDQSDVKKEITFQKQDLRDREPGSGVDRLDDIIGSERKQGRKGTCKQEYKTG